MKSYRLFFMAIVFVFSSNCFAQVHDPASLNLAIKNASKDNIVIAAYYVEETINMPFGKRITKYEVSKLDMVNTYDLGPNNTRIVTPIYRKPKVKTIDVGLQSKSIVDSIVATVQPVEVALVAPAEAPRYINIDVVSTYAKVLDKGYKSVEMLTKVADRAYFDGDLTTAAKYYEELIAMETNLDTMYYYRYAQSLKGINQTEKANEAMLLFESKNTGNNVMKHNKLVRN